MNISKRSPSHLVVLLMFTVGLTACGVDAMDTACDGGRCVDSMSAGTLAQGMDCGEQSNCDDDPGAGGSTGTATITVVLANALPVQATFYADGGGVYATTTYHVTRWTPAGGGATLTGAMAGPVGQPLSMVTMLAAEGFPRYTKECVVVPTSASATCTIRAAQDVDGFAVLSCSCIAQ